MKHLTKLFRATIAIAIMLCVALPTFGHDFEVNGIYYNYLDETAKTVEVTYKGSDCYSYYNEYTGAVSIPSSVTYNSTTYSVTTIGSDAFEDCTDLTSVTIPNSVTSIGYRAFYNTGWYNNQPDGILYLDNWCLGYKGNRPTGTLSIKEGTRLIGNSAFWGCSGLTSVTIPNSVTTIGDRAFDGCSGLTSVTIPNSVTSIGENAFTECTGLTSVSIGNSVTSIGRAAFYGCSGLTSVTIPNSVTSIGDAVFVYCTGLTSVTIPNSVTSIGSSAFYGCTGLTSVTIPNSVTSIGYTVFYKCTGLTSVTIPNSVTSIGPGAFGACTGLTSVTIPNSVTSIGIGAFGACTGLTELNFNAENCTSMGSSSDPVFNNCSNLKTINIGNNVKTIPASSFSGCTGLTEVNIPDLSAWCKINFGSYDANPLYYANKLKLNGTEIKDLVIPNDITEIKKYAFYGCSGLTSVTIPNSVTSIGKNAFTECTGLTSVSIGNSVTSIGYRAFYNTGWYKKQPDGILYLDNCCLGYKGNEPTGTLYIKVGTRLIAESAFYYCDLAVLHLPKSVTYVGRGNHCADVCYCYNPTPPSGGGFTSYRLFVPKGSLMAYATAEGWKDAEQILEFEVDDVVKPILTIAYPEGGVIKQTVDNGEILMLQIVPANGWKCNSVTFNGIDVTNQLDANGNYNTPSITANSQLSIVFVKNDGSVANALVDSDIKVYVKGNTVTITGADEFSDVEIYNTAGTTIYTGIDKSITIDSTGIYILTVEGRTFKFAM